MTRQKVNDLTAQLLDSCPSHPDEQWLVYVLCREPPITEELVSKLIELIEKYIGYGVES